MTDKPLAGYSDARSKDARSNKNSTRTPPDLFARRDAVHHFTLDIAADHDNALVRGSYCTVDGHYADGLQLARIDGIAMAEVWTPDDGAGWCNPPYGVGLLAPFIYAWSEAAQIRGVVSEFLVPVRTDQPWWHDRVWDNESSATYPWVTRLEFIEGRLGYLDHQGKPILDGKGKPAKAGFESCIITFGAPL
ncbi:MAG: DNA N-6-adenine-methyltransferase [Dehalococcoidia bacterium]